MELPMPALAAPVHLRNAAVAIAALRALPKAPKALPRPAIAEGVAGATVAGRLQRFERAGVEILVDVAHNPQAARALSAWLAASPQRGDLHAVYAALNDKDAAGVVGELAPRVARWHLAGLADAGARGGDAQALAARLRDTAAAEGGRHDDVADALAAALDGAKKGDRVLVFGSFHTAAAALEWLARD
jgi:dihydrofolate synthase/folylpolyglutamate synthase